MSKPRSFMVVIGLLGVAVVGLTGWRAAELGDGTATVGGDGAAFVTADGGRGDEAASPDSRLGTRSRTPELAASDGSERPKVQPLVVGTDEQLTSDAEQGRPPTDPASGEDVTASDDQPVTGAAGTATGAATDAPATATTTRVPSTTPPTTGRSTAQRPTTLPPTTKPPTTQAATTKPPTSATAPPPSNQSEYFSTLGPGAKLPSGAECASRVRPVPENVPENVPYNQTRGRKITGTYFSTNTAIAKNDYESRIDGNFVGSTDEIIQWASCKWGFDEDRVRAQVYAESSWFAGRLGDCGEQTHARTGGNGGCASVGLIQVRSAETGPTHNPGAYPAVLESSAMNLDYALAIRRLCYEGKESWLSQTNGNYGAGDEWGCIGRWFSGDFKTGKASEYVWYIRRLVGERKWETQWVGCPDWRESFYCTGLDKPIVN